MNRLLWRVLDVVGEWAAGAYVVGPELSDAVRACRALEARGFSSTICAWNADGSPIEENAARYAAALDAIKTEKLDCYVSLKAQDLAFSPERVAELFARAAALGGGIHFDSRGPEQAERMFSLIGALPLSSGTVGCTIPGRWRRSPADADRAAALGLRIRIVKGQWDDPEVPGIDLREGFLAVVERLAGRARKVSVATHDAALARLALERLRGAGTAAELELLFGLPARRALAVAKAMGVPVRVYIPYGFPRRPYLFSEVKRNPRIAWWVLRDLVRGRLSPDFSLPRGRA
ncbi:MAG: proline dehydrogenase [Alphaproteobacteria bacterium]